MEQKYIAYECDVPKLNNKIQTRYISVNIMFLDIIQCPVYV
jgi:hypothetical protein